MINKQKRKDLYNMSFKVIQNIPSPEEMLEKVAMSPKLQAIKKQRDEEMKAILEGKENKFIVVIGPCSASDEDAVCDYV